MQTVWAAVVALLAVSVAAPPTSAYSKTLSLREIQEAIALGKASHASILQGGQPLWVDISRFYEVKMRWVPKPRAT